MERDLRKRKRVVKEEETLLQPSEEEVDEFFAILKRMRVAVKYFKNRGTSADGKGAAGTAAEEKSGFDLNSAPDSESNSS